MAKAMKAMKAMAMKAKAMKAMKAKAMKAKRWWRPPGTRLVWGYRMPIAGAWVHFAMPIPKAMVGAKKPRKAMKAM